MRCTLTNAGLWTALRVRNRVKSHVGVEAAPSVRATIIWSSKMHLSGHYSNPPEALEAALAALPEGGVSDRRRDSAVLKPAARRLDNGDIQRAVIRILEAADGPLSVAEVRLAVERSLGKVVSRSSVNACLSVGARRVGRFERVAAGLYRLAP
jgi:hypothetical protein